MKVKKEVFLEEEEEIKLKNLFHLFVSLLMEGFQMQIIYFEGVKMLH